MFKAMHVHVTEADAEQIFNSIDYDQSGTIQWAEFKLDFDRCVTSSLDELEAEEKIMQQGNDDELGGPGRDYEGNASLKSAM